MSLKILIDMNLSPEWGEVFRHAGWEARHWSEIGKPTAEDVVIMQWAQANSYVVFTHDLDFSAILAATRAAGPSVVQLRIQNILPETMSGTVVAVLRQHEAVLIAGALLVVDHARQRLRILPLG
jgi:predicted nuclease of predicted toxin-antitoxin system